MSKILAGCLEARKNELAALLNELAEARTEGAQISGEWDAAYETWYKAHNDLGQKMEAAQRKECELAATVREKTLELYNLTGSKKPVEGVAIKEITKVSYDENAVRLWAIAENQFMVLGLVKPTFDAWAKAVAGEGLDLPPTCKVEKVPRAEIAGKL
jgi:hypothetical protein